MYFVYLLQSQKDFQWYTGFTENIEQRLSSHNAGKNISTAERRPWVMIYYEAYLNKSDALGRERFLKSGSGHRFLRKQLQNFFNPTINPS
ncbi:GIY-YIG nuclease family protein [Patescibacteria group bacterium]|nr:GIY-YIG nuclease family protein [Patescibacteria group bacterium]